MDLFTTNLRYTDITREDIGRPWRDVPVTLTYGWMQDETRIQPFSTDEERAARLFRRDEKKRQLQERLEREKRERTMKLIESFENRILGT